MCRCPGGGRRCVGVREEVEDVRCPGGGRRCVGVREEVEDV